MDERLRIVVDVGERRSGMPGALEALGALVEIGRLRAGDYDLGGGCIVERKTVPDLHGSILGGRFWPQVGALKASCEAPHLLVEGLALDVGPLHPNSIRGACIAATELGLVVLRTEGVQDTARWLHRLALRRRRRRGHPGTRPAYAQRPKASGPGAAAEAALASVPGISVVSARALLDRFGTVHEVLLASPAALMAVPGVGPAKARALREVLCGAPPPTREATPS